MSSSSRSRNAPTAKSTFIAWTTFVARNDGDGILASRLSPALLAVDPEAYPGLLFDLAFGGPALDDVTPILAVETFCSCMVMIAPSPVFRLPAPGAGDRYEELFLVRHVA
jgi:hypothetical protein